jgi:hypothetical protein
MPTTDEMTIDERRKYLKRMKPRSVAAKRSDRSRMPDRNGTGDWHASQKFDAPVACSQLRAQETQAAACAQVRPRGGAGGASSLGKPGLHLCGTTHPQLAVDGEATGSLWPPEPDLAPGDAAGHNQLFDGGAHLAQEPLPQRALPAQGTLAWPIK